MSARQTQARPEPGVEKLPPLTDAQVARVAALLSLGSRRRVIEGQGGRS